MNAEEITFKTVLASITTFDREIFMFLLRVGLLFIQLSSKPTNNRNVIILHNVLEISLATILYGIVHYVIVNGHNAWQMIDQWNWISPKDSNMDDAITGWATVITATGLFTTMVDGRMHLVAFVSISTIMAALIDPIMIHWVRPNKSVVHSYDPRSVLMAYKDMGGCAIIHVCVGCVALLAVIFLGSRLKCFKNVSRSSLSSRSPRICMIGYVLLMVGLIALYIPASYDITHTPRKYIGTILMNNIMAIAGGIFAVVLIRFVVEKCPINWCTMLRCMQGAIAGIVVISSGVDVYTPVTALALGITGGAIYSFVTRQSASSPWENYYSMIPIHLICGLVSMLMSPIFGASEGVVLGGKSLTAVVNQVYRQSLYNASLLASLFLIFLPVFLLLHCLGLVHNGDNEFGYRRAQTVLQSSVPKRSFLQQVSRPGKHSELNKPGNDTEYERQKLKALREKQKAYLRHFNPRLANQTTSRNMTDA